MHPTRPGAHAPSIAHDCPAFLTRELPSIRIADDTVQIGGALHASGPGLGLEGGIDNTTEAAAAAVTATVAAAAVAGSALADGGAAAANAAIAAAVTGPVPADGGAAAAAAVAGPVPADGGGATADAIAAADAAAATTTAIAAATAAATAAPRRSSRTPSTLGPTPAYKPAWSAYDDGRRGTRHARTRDVSYDELVKQREDWERQKEEQALQTEAWLHEVDQLVMQCEVIVREMPPEHAPAIRALQEALMEMVADAEGDVDIAEIDGAAMECDPCEEDEPEPCEIATESEQVATAFFERIADELAWTDPTSALPSPPLGLLAASFEGCTGGLLLTAHQLMWVAAGAHFSQARVRIPLISIREQRSLQHRSPFGSHAEFVVVDVCGSTIKFACGSRLGAVEAFSREVAMSIEALPSTTTATATATVTTTTAAAPAAAAPARRQTKQVLAAVDLRAKLKKVVELQRSHAAGSTAEAAATLERLARQYP